eukprot:TRINITY_DN19139_c0_g1_i1.p1 TRINITY_DN19139_c0_g1~~TRINITY_DN19139_c0_g1_i1.p1  ORF type:complete len:804 (+),score=104.94 TRINITY_DN19139_c0_g1_i1:333-2414(+)
MEGFLEWQLSEGNRFVSSQYDATKRFVISLVQAMSSTDGFHKQISRCSSVHGDGESTLGGGCDEKVTGPDIVSAKAPLVVVQSVNRVHDYGLLKNDTGSPIAWEGLCSAAKSTSPTGRNTPTQVNIPGCTKSIPWSSAQDSSHQSEGGARGARTPLPGFFTRAGQQDAIKLGIARERSWDSHTKPPPPEKVAIVMPPRDQFSVLERADDTEKVDDDVSEDGDNKKVRVGYTDSFSKRVSTRLFDDTASASPEKQRIVFPTEEEMKEKVREACLKDTNVVRFYKQSGLAREIATNPWFEHLTGFVILFNAVWIAVDTDWNRTETLLESEWYFQFFEHALCAFFLFEWAIRFAAFHDKWNCFSDAWFVFDGCLVAAFVFETWLVSVLAEVSGLRDKVPILRNVSVVRIFRLARISRLARIAKLLRAVPELMILIKGMVVASSCVCFTFGLLLTIIYVFAIALTNILRDSAVGAEFFGSVWASMVSLALYCTLGENLPDIALAVGAESWLAGVVLFVFVLLGSLTVLNLLIGILVEVVGVVASVEKEEMTCNFVIAQLRFALSELDSNGDLSISLEEFREMLDKPAVIRALNDISVDVPALVSNADTIFKDGDELTFSRFVEVIMELRGTNKATVKDIVNLRTFLGKEMETMDRRVRKVVNESVTHALGGRDRPRLRSAGSDKPSLRASTMAEDDL